MKDNKIEDWKDVVVDDKDNKWINPKMLLSKDECHSKHYYEKDRNNGVVADIDGWKEYLKEDDRIPSYYKGKNGYEARKVVDNFDLSYNVGTCVTYLLRCGKKTEEGMDIRDKHIEDIQKGINHLLFEIERLKE